MRIALLGPWTRSPLDPWLGDAAAGLPPGGRGMVMTLLASALLDAGHEVHVVSLDPEVDAPTSASTGPLDVSLLPLRPGGRGRDAYKVERAALARAIGDLEADVVNAHWAYEYAMAAARHPSPRVVTVHDWAPLELWYKPDPYRAVRMGMYVAALAGRPRATAPSPQMVRRLRRVGLARTTVVPNGLSDDLIGPGPRTGPTGQQLLAVADGFGRRKNTVTLLRALPLIRQHCPDVTLTLIGPQHGDGEEAQTWAAAEGLADGVVFAGFTPHHEVMALMRRADLLVHPAREETFGMVLIEAMAQGTPVIGGRSSGAVPWVVGEGRSGSLVDITSPRAIAAEVIALLTDPSRWALMSDAGFANVRDRFTMPVVAQGYVDVYHRAILEAAG